MAASRRPSRSPIRSSPPSTLTIAPAVPGESAAQQRLEDGGLGRGARRRLGRLERLADLDQGRFAVGIRRVSGRGEHVRTAVATSDDRS